MIRPLTAPFFEIGPKNLLRRRALEELALAAGAAASRHGITVVLTVPSVMVAPVADLHSGVLVFAQSMDVDEMGPSVGRVTVEALVDAGADGVMLNHDAAPLDEGTLAAAVRRARSIGLRTIVVAGTHAEALHAAALGPTAVLLEPSELIGTVGAGERTWIPSVNQALHQVDPQILAMHAGGVGSPEAARSIMASGADGTGSTSGVLAATDPLRAAAAFIAAAKEGWESTPFEDSTRSES
ncbi:triose-phosphate isomerase [Brachybacterium sacelli]|uniref:Triosephosphate isomerase n=1 Tax=Brachybacterium sacelli TaxID=173364 RepID=A0ABS4WZ53_9MICO|nr:triosephosphate isomerase [Brachybacterium sacelli]